MPLGCLLAEADPAPGVVSACALTRPRRPGGGWQWFWYAGVTEEPPGARIAEAMLSFPCQGARLAGEGKGDAAATTLVGF